MAGTTPRNRDIRGRSRTSCRSGIGNFNCPVYSGDRNGDGNRPRDAYPRGGPIVAALFALGIIIAHDDSAILAQDHSKRVHALVFAARGAMGDPRRLGGRLVPWLANSSTQ